MAEGKNNNEDFDRDIKWYSIEELNLEGPVPFHVGQQMSQNDVISLFDLICGGESRKDYRVGITLDTEQREEEHAADFTAVINCYSLKNANELEKYAHDNGFDTGGSCRKRSRSKEYKSIYISQRTGYDRVEAIMKYMS